MSVLLTGEPSDVFVLLTINGTSESGKGIAITQVPGQGTQIRQIQHGLISIVQETDMNF